MNKKKLYLAILWGLTGAIAGETLAASDLFNNPVGVIGTKPQPDLFNSPVGVIGSPATPTAAPAPAPTATPVTESKPAAATTPEVIAPPATQAPQTGQSASIAADTTPVVADAQAPQAGKSKLWSYQPVKTPDQPAVNNKAWVRTPIDAFILAPLEAKGLAPSPDADRAAFVRRATLDAWGVIPSPEEVAAFVNDTGPDAYEKLADRLLASTKYGERQARRWLDLAR